MPHTTLQLIAMSHSVPGYVFQRGFNVVSGHLVSMSFCSCLQDQYFFDVVTKMLDVDTNSAQLMSTCYALNLSWGESSFVPRQGLVYITCVSKVTKLGSHRPGTNGASICAQKYDQLDILMM